MNRRRAALFTLFMRLTPGAILMTGCASRREASFDPALFPRSPSPPGPKEAGRIAVQLQPAFEHLMYEGEEGPATRLRIPIGQIVAEAMLASADQQFAGGALRVNSAAETRGGPGFAAALLIQSVQADYHSKLLWAIPVPFLGVVSDWEFDAQLSIDISLLDPQGQPLWTRHYDDGRRPWKHDWTEQTQAPDALVRMTHEAAWRLSQRALLDLLDWVRAERLRPRSL